MHLTHEELSHRCAATVDQLITRHGWSLLDRVTLLQRLLEEAERQPGVEIGYLALGVYNQALHRACHGVEGPARWHLAYGELHRMLYEQARRRAPDICEDAAQEALALIVAGLGRCREPRAFFTFARQQLQLALRKIGRRERRPTLSLDRAVGDEGASLGEGLAASDEEIEVAMVSAELAGEVRVILDEIVRQSPQSLRQIEAVRLKFLDGLDDEAIALRLGISVKSVHEARSRGLRRLREHPRFRQVYDAGM